MSSGRASTFRNTAPQALLGGGAPAPATQAVVSPAPDFSLLGSVGAELAGPVATMEYILQEYKRKRTLTDNHMRLLKGAVAATRQVAMQSQHLARVVHGKIKQSHERLKLDDLLRSALNDHARQFQARGVELHQSIRPVEVIVDPGLLTALLDAAISWSLTVGQKLMVSLDMKHWPQHGLLIFKSSQSIAAAAGEESRPETDSLTWHLLQQIGVAMGVSAERVRSDTEAILMLEFPRTVQQLEGLTAVEIETGYDSLQSEPRALAGHRLLVVTEDEKLVFDIKMVARGMSLEMDVVPGPMQAVRACELELPHIIVIDERVRNRIFDELRDDLLRLNPNFPFIEIAIASNTLEIASWMTESMARVSRDSLRSQLPSILALELAKTM